MKRFTLLVPPLLACVLTGCGTLGNTIGIRDSSEHLRVYGGVRLDAARIQECAIGCEKSGGFGHSFYDTVATCEAVADIPFSVVGDTLTLPFTVPDEIDRILHPESHISTRLARVATAEPDRPASP
jgi:uncharacterized protein YceK